LDNYIEPHSEIRPAAEYAIRCVSDANSINSRKWRIWFLESFLSGTYKKEIPKGNAGYLYYIFLYDIKLEGADMCPPANVLCPICEKEESFNPTKRKYLVGWPKGESTFHLSNSHWIHEQCIKGRKRSKVKDRNGSIWK